MADAPYYLSPFENIVGCHWGDRDEPGEGESGLWCGIVGFMESPSVPDLKPYQMRVDVMTGIGGYFINGSGEIEYGTPDQFPALSPGYSVIGDSGSVSGIAAQTLVNGNYGPAAYWAGFSYFAPIYSYDGGGPGDYSFHTVGTVSFAHLSILNFDGSVGWVLDRVVPETGLGYSHAALFKRAVI